MQWGVLDNILQHVAGNDNVLELDVLCSHLGASSNVYHHIFLLIIHLKKIVSTLASLPAKKEEPFTKRRALNEGLQFHVILTFFLI
ncbi:hypothetical protein PN4B1_28180 [Paenibacillus naphthalenovorans]|nr:hypothetical protein PN4B1_28180 [Paenibacillus naphthalenovorans]